MKPIRYSGAFLRCLLMLNWLFCVPPQTFFHHSTRRREGVSARGGGGGWEGTVTKPT